MKTLIQPRKLANKGGQLSYHWKISDFERLDGLLYSDQGSISAELTGRTDDRHRNLVETTIKANVQLQCQTTFEPIHYAIDTKVVYCSVISEEQIANLDDEYEPLLVEDGAVDIKRVIEDELILSLPIIANKSSEEIGLNMTFGELPNVEEEKKNPFTVLEGLKINRDD